MADSPLRLLILGAHPDDAEYHAGGLATLYRGSGHTVKMVSVTDGRSGHQSISPSELIGIRRAEAAASGAVIGAEYVTWDNPDGSLVPSLAIREQIIREIRTFCPDLVLTHRTNDYHPDHRAVGQSVQDASFLVTVPGVVADVPALRRDPVVGYLPDRFTKPTPLAGDVVLDVGGQIDTIVAMLDCHRSQFYDWLPYNRGEREPVPESPGERIAWLRRWYTDLLRPMAERYRRELIASYGDERGRSVEFCEVFEISEYAAPLDAPARARLFPWAGPCGTMDT